MVKIEHYTVLCRQRRIVNGLLALQEALLPQAARATRFVSENRYSWRRHSGNYCDDHCSPCSAESASLPKVDFESILSTDSTSRSLDRFDRSTRLESTLSIDSTSVLIGQLDRSTRSISRSNSVGVENCHLPLTKPVAVNTGLALPRSPWSWIFGIAIYRGIVSIAQP